MKEEKSQDIMAKEVVPQEVAPQEVAPQEVAPQEVEDNLDIKNEIIEVINIGAPKKKRKKLKKGALVAIILVVVIFATVGGGLLWFFWDSFFYKPQNSDLGAYYGYFGYAPDTTSEDAAYIDYSERLALFQKEIDDGMREDATNEEKALAAYIIYRIACLADATAGKKAKYSIGTGLAGGGVTWGSNSLQASGYMNLTATYYTLRTPFLPLPTIDTIYIPGQYGTYEVSEEYTQVPKGGVTMSNDSLQELGEVVVSMFFPFSRRSIITPDTGVVWSGVNASTVITPERAIGEFNDKKRDFDIKTNQELAEERKVYEREYPEDWGDIYGLTAKDTSIHIVNPKTIIGSSVEIAKHQGSSLSEKRIDYYSVKFEIDTETGRGTPNSATHYAEKLYISQLPKEYFELIDSYDLHYSRLNVEMTVFENGYFRTWGTDEAWVMGGTTSKFGGISADLTSEVSSTEAYCYDYDTIMQGFANRYFGDKQYVNLPKSNLPFYAELSQYPPQAYGDYR